MTDAKNTPHYDVIVIGGGPAGMIAAITAGRLGASVLLLEKNEDLGKKLLITGGGRCNIANNIEDVHLLLSKFKDAAPFLYSPFSQFSLPETRVFFEELGLPFKEEAAGRLFPAHGRSGAVLSALKNGLEKARVITRTQCVVQKMRFDPDNAHWEVRIKDAIYTGKNIIIGTGGLSHPETGSTGDGFTWLKMLGHTINKPNPSLVPIRTKETWTHRLSGISKEAVRVSIILDGKTVTKKEGKVLFTHFGLSAPLILNMSSAIFANLQKGNVSLTIDLFPKYDEGALLTWLHEQLQPIQNKQIKNALCEILEKELAKELVLQLRLDGERATHQLTKEERRRIVHFLKHIMVTPIGLMGADRAIVTSGGVPLSEINTRTMASKINPTLFIVGDTLDIDRPSGGFSLQLCWTTGYVAGKHAAI
jgi:predicted Rossmann fold flavoprotein